MKDYIYINSGERERGLTNVRVDKGGNLMLNLRRNGIKLALNFIVSVCCNLL